MPKNPVTPHSFSPRLSLRLWFGVLPTGLLLQLPVRAGCGEEGPNGNSDAVAGRDDSAGTKKQAREIKRLIDALASRNKAPVQRGKGGDLRLEYPDDYDQQADEVVKSAGDKLIAHGAA